VNNRTAVSVAVFVLFILLPRLEAQVIPEAGWYLSDPAGLALESIPDPAGYEYSLRVRKQDAAVSSELFHDGKTVKTWIRTYGANGFLSREAMETDGLLKEEFMYDAQGHPSMERIFLENGAIEETAYEYASGQLVSRTTTAGGATVSKRTYLYAPDGRLALAREESGSESGTSAARSGASSSWRIGATGLELRTYDATGRLVLISIYDGADRLSQEDHVWKEGTLERVTVVLAGGTTTSTEYVVSGPARGNISAIRVTNSDESVSTEQRTYNGKGQLASVETYLRDRESVVTYGYGDDDVLASTTTSVEGVLVSVVRHEASTVRVEELYDSGAMFARVRYEDGRRVLEEMLRDGVVTRTRRFP
jgi:hypothetical protein